MGKGHLSDQPVPKVSQFLSGRDRIYSQACDSEAALLMMSSKAFQENVPGISCVPGTRLSATHLSSPHRLQFPECPHTPQTGPRFSHICIFTWNMLFAPPLSGNIYLSLQSWIKCRIFLEVSNTTLRSKYFLPGVLRLLIWPPGQSAAFKRWWHRNW